MSERRYRTARGDSRVILKTLADNSIDALVTDPPAGIDFMGKDWDCFRRSHNPADVGRENVFGRTSAHAPHSYGESDRGRFIAFLTPIFAECLRALKPGAHGLVWALPRTSHWTAMALEDAGFEIRDTVHHAYAQGFPKSLNVGKSIDKAAGAERRVIASGAPVKRMIPGADQNATGSWIKDNGRVFVPTETAPATAEAERWEGWGTALKPAIENWILVRKPLEKATVAANVLAYGTGALNIDSCRIGRATDDVPGWHKTGSYGRADGYMGEDTFKIRDMPPEEVQARCGSKGRWPANLVLSHSPNCVLIGTHKVKGCPAEVVQGGKDGGGFDVGFSDGTRRTVFQGYGDEEGLEEVEKWACVPECGVRQLERQAPNASRFFYCAKPSKREKSLGLEEGAINFHPTVKSVTLCRHLIKLITPPGGTVLDCFAGSGSIGVAALAEGFKFLGIEQDETYYATMRARLAHAEQDASFVSD